MGSNQSSSANLDAESFSIDPSGNITRKNPSRPSEIHASSAGEQQQYSDKKNNNTTSSGNTFDSNINNEAPATPIDEPPSFIVPEQPISSAPVVVSSGQKPSDDLSLTEAEQIVNNLKAKYKPNDLDMAGKKNSVFDEVERNLVQCYAANKNQTMNCSKAYQEYKNYVDIQRRQVLKKTVNVPLVTTVLMIVTCVLLHVTQISCYGAMSIDLGSEWMKVGLVAPSVQMDIVLNAQSQRKTPMAIAFSNGERFIGDTALDVASKYPDRTYTHFLDLVGKTIEHESVKHYKQRFPYANISPAKATTTTSPESSPSIILNHPEGLEFTPLELIAMMLQHAHDQVVSRLNSNEPASDVVITVPPFFGPAERQVIEDAAKLVGLNVLRLTNTNSAFALSYGIFRHKDYLPESDENKTSILFFDQGASHSSLTLADYNLVEQIDPTTGLSKNESLPTIKIRAQVYDRYLGGFDMQLKLRDHLVKAFAKKTGIKESRITQRGKSMAKLLKESGRVKKILSANTEHVVRVENVIDDKDLKEPITRQEFEELNKEYLGERITNLLDRLFEIEGISRQERFESVIIVGGNTRTPRIQQTLLEYFKLDTLGKSINADEGAALAALYQAASLGRGFRVKKFMLIEFNETSTQNADIPSTTTASSTSTDSTSAEGSTEASATAGEQQPVTKDPLEGSRKKLAALREQDHLRLQRLSLRNSLESLISEARDKLDGEKDADKLKQVSEAYAWLEDGPQQETDNVTILADKFDAIHELVYPKPPPPMFDPSIVDLSKVLNNETLSVLNSLNLTNPFAQSDNDSAPTSNETSGGTTTTTPKTLEPVPAPSVTSPPPSQEASSGEPDAKKKRGPPPHSEL